LSSSDLESDGVIAFSEPLATAEAPPVSATVIDRQKKPSLAYLIAALAGGNLLSTAFGLAGGLLQARFVDKVTLGTFASFGLALSWSCYLQLGIFNGLNRELPYYYGKGDRGKAIDLAGTARAWLLASGAIVACSFLAMAAWNALQGNAMMAFGWGAHAVLAIVYFYGTLYLQATYRTVHDFARLSAATTLQNAAGVVLVISVFWFGFEGLCLRAVLTSLIGLALLHWWRPIVVRWRWKFDDFRHLLVIGFPIFVVGELSSRLWFLIDSTLVNHYLKAGGLGLYKVVEIARTTAEIIPIAMGQIMYPRMTEYYGRAHDFVGTLKMTFRPMAFVFLTMIPLVALGWLLARPLTKILLPNFIDAVPAMRWSLLLPLVLSCTTTHNLYNICRRQDLYLVVILMELGSYAGALMYLCRGGVYLEAFPQSLLVGRIVYALAGYLLLVPIYRSWKKQQENTAART
jgi:O-antigen/teichoic acid export membrane protein